MTKPRKGQFGDMLNREEFHSRFQGSFGHPAFEQVGEALAQVVGHAKFIRRHEM